MMPAPPVQRLRLLHVVLTLDQGGTERLVVDMANRLVAAGSDVQICCLDGVGAMASALAPGVGLHEIRRPSHFDPRVGWWIARLASSLGVGVIHCHQYTPFVYGCVARLCAPSLGIVFTEHGRLAGAVVSAKRRAVNRVLTRVGGEQFAVSQELRRFMLDEGFSPDRLEVLHNGIDPRPAVDPAEREAGRRLLGGSAGDLIVGTTARFDPVKDLGGLVSACARARAVLPRLRLVLIGDGPCRLDLQARAQAEGLDRIAITGYRTDVPALLPGLDIYVNTSTSEGISVAVLEAMAASRAVVATAVGGTPEIIRDGVDGRLVPSRDPVSLAAVLVELGKDAGERARLGTAARQRVAEAFSSARMIEQYVAAYQRAGRRVVRR